MQKYQTSQLCQVMIVDFEKTSTTTRVEFRSPMMGGRIEMMKSSRVCKKKGSCLTFHMIDNEERCLLEHLVQVEGTKGSLHAHRSRPVEMKLSAVILRFSYPHKEGIPRKL